MTIKEIEEVCYVGAGTMGCANSLVAAISGYRVVIYDANSDCLGQVTARQAEMAGYLIGIGYCTAQDVAASTARITCNDDLSAAVANADLVSESIVEDLAVKRTVHAELDRLCPTRTILTTNTSGLLVSEIEDAVDRGDRFAALHSHFGSLLIDIVGGPRTSATTIDTLKRYVIDSNCIPLVLRKENRGYVLNSLIGPVITAAMMLDIHGVATREQVDRAWMKFHGAQVGPFGMMDLFGLNIVYDGWQHRSRDESSEPLRSQVLAMLKPYIDNKELGTKTGKGFYRYPNAAFAENGFLDAEQDHELAHLTLTTVLIGNAILLAADGVSEPNEIDHAWRAGMNLSRGPFEILEQMTPKVILELINELPGTLRTEQMASVTAYLSQQEQSTRANR